MARIKLTDNARHYRRRMWLTTIAGLPALLLAIRGIQERVPVVLGILGALIFLGSIGMAAMLGRKMHSQSLADREMHSRRAMIVMMTATLGKETDESLETIRDRGGLSGEAAGLILKGRQAKADAQANE
ncbi:MAG: hypothetical protein V3R71_07325 [Gemmatimonadales bacterium]